MRIRGLLVSWIRIQFEPNKLMVLCSIKYKCIRGIRLSKALPGSGSVEKSTGSFYLRFSFLWRWLLLYGNLFPRVGFRGRGQHFLFLFILAFFLFTVLLFCHFLFLFDNVLLCNFFFLWSFFPSPAFLSWLLVVCYIFYNDSKFQSFNNANYSS